MRSEELSRGERLRRGMRRLDAALSSAPPKIYCGAENALGRFAAEASKNLLNMSVPPTCGFADILSAKVKITTKNTKK